MVYGFKKYNQKNNKHKEKTIRLLSCSTSSTDKNFAQNLANKFNVSVISPKKYLWANPNGTHYVAGGRINLNGKLEPIVSDLGYVVIYRLSITFDV